MHFDLSRSHPQLGLWRTTHTVDPVVLRHVRVCQVMFGLCCILVLGAFAVLFSPKPWVALILFGLAFLGFLGASCSNPAGKSGAAFWVLKAIARLGHRVELYADGFVLFGDRPEGQTCRWDDVTALRHPLFRASVWTREEDQVCYTQKTARLLVELLGGEVVEFSDLLENVEVLNETVQREVYPRLLDRARRRLRDGRTESFEPFEVGTEGIRSRTGFLAWPQIESMELKGTTIHLKERDGPWNGDRRAEVTMVPNFPVLLSLLEELQPDLSRDLLEGLPLDSAAHLWQRVSKLRETIPTPPGGPGGARPEPVPAGDDVPDHSGRPSRSATDLFVPAPSEIGPLVSAGSTLRTDVQPLSFEARALIVLVSAGVGGGIGLLIIYLAAVTKWYWLTLWLAVPPLVGASIAWGTTAFAHTCTYVGTEGLARYRCAGSRGRIVEGTVFLFRDAVAVRSSLTHRYHKGAYQGSDYVFDWTNTTGRSLFRIKGTYRSEKEPPPADDLYHFGEAAEVAWSLCRLDDAQSELDRDGCVRFALKSGGAVRVGPGFIDFGAGGEGYCSVDDLAETTVKDNVIRFRRRDAEEGWFTSRGIYKLTLGDLANSKLFLFLLRTLVAFGSTRAGEGFRRHATFLDQLADAVHVPWRHDARAEAFVCKSLEPEAAERALRHLRTGRPSE
jgi:hypothetical protein